MSIALARTEEPPLAEFGIVPEIYADGLGRVEDHGGNVRFALYKNRWTGDRQIVLYLVMPTSAIAPSIEKTLMTLGATLLQAPTRFLQRLFN